ncbi:MAG: hypothetical protein RLZZ283_704 [Candidatus Parcubacteria bacterium]|jgi:hypothetical protein
MEITADGFVKWKKLPNWSSYPKLNGTHKKGDKVRLGHRVCEVVSRVPLEKGRYQYIKGGQEVTVRCITSGEEIKTQA